MNAHPLECTAYGKDARVREFLADSLALWRIAGTVEAGEPPIVAVIRSGTDTIVRVERAQRADVPFRWLLRSYGNDRVRPCASLVGLLNGLRSVLGVERGDAVRIAPTPGDG